MFQYEKGYISKGNFCIQDQFNLVLENQDRFLRQSILGSNLVSPAS